MRESEIEKRCGELYAAFAGYRVTLPVSGCPCCIPQLPAAFFEQNSFDALATRDVDLYSRKAISTIGTVDDFKHFLPRILELVAQDPEQFCLPEVVFAKLDLAGWQDWSEAERAALQAFLDAFWVDQLRRSGHEDSVDTVLVSLGQCSPTVKPYLTRWLAEPSATAVSHLACFLLTNRESLEAERILANPFWEQRPKQAAEVIEWTASAAPREFLCEHAALVQGQYWGSSLRDLIREVL